MLGNDTKNEKRDAVESVPEKMNCEIEFDSSKMLDEKKDVSDFDGICISCGNLENGGSACL